MTRAPYGMPPSGGPVMPPGGDKPLTVIPPRLSLRVFFWLLVGMALFALVAFGLAWLLS